MFIINNKLRILSAVILAVASSATILSSCGGEDTPEIPVETVIGTQGEILGVSIITEEGKPETQTVLYELTPQKTSDSNAKKSDAAKANISAVNTESVTENIKTDKTEPVSQKTTSLTSVKNEKPKFEFNWFKDKDDKTEKTENKTKSDNLNTTKTETTEKKDKSDKENTTKHIAPSESLKSTTRVASVTKNSSIETQHETIPYITREPKPKTTKKPKQTTVKQTQAEETSKKESYNENVKDESQGINVVFKTDSVEKGTTASIMIQGTPGEKYSIDFYVSPTDTADYAGLEDQTADENGFITWAFDIPMNLDSGNKKLVIKEKGSDNYIQTSIKIN